MEALARYGIPLRQSQSGLVASIMSRETLFNLKSFESVPLWTFESCGCRADRFSPSVETQTRASGAGEKLTAQQHNHIPLLAKRLETRMTAYKSSFMPQTPSLSAASDRLASATRINRATSPSTAHNISPVRRQSGILTITNIVGKDHA